MVLAPFDDVYASLVHFIRQSACNCTENQHKPYLVLISFSNVSPGLIHVILQPLKPVCWELIRVNVDARWADNPGPASYGIEVYAANSQTTSVSSLLLHAHIVPSCLTRSTVAIAVAATVDYRTADIVLLVVSCTVHRKR